jgi:hypothetical protein
MTQTSSDPSFPSTGIIATRSISLLDGIIYVRNNLQTRKIKIENQVTNNNLKKYVKREKVNIIKLA